MPLAQSRELPPPKSYDGINPKRLCEASSGFNHQGIGVDVEIVKGEDFYVSAT